MLYKSLTIHHLKNCSKSSQPELVARNMYIIYTWRTALVYFFSSAVSYMTLNKLPKYLKGTTNKNDVNGGHDTRVGRQLVGDPQE